MSVIENTTKLDTSKGESLTTLHIVLKENATNGDVIKKLFPKGKARHEPSWTHDKTVFSFPDGTYFGAECRFNTDWWNAPYNGGMENEQSL